MWPMNEYDCSSHATSQMITNHNQFFSLFALLRDDVDAKFVLLARFYSSLCVCASPARHSISLCLAVFPFANVNMDPSLRPYFMQGIRLLLLHATVNNFNWVENKKLYTIHAHTEHTFVRSESSRIRRYKTSR